MDEVHLILEHTFIEIYMVNVKRKPVCRDSKDVCLILIRTPMVRGAKLNLVLINQIKNVQIMVVV